MDFKTYLNNLSADDRAELAEACKTSVGQLNNVAYGYRSCSPILANCIERFTKAAITRQKLRPDDYWLIWPDLKAPRKQAA